MYVHKHQNAAGSKITVTATATNIFDLINTAASTTSVNAGFQVEKINAINIFPEDGDVRYLMDGNTPTSTNGILVKQGERLMLRNCPVKHLKLIRVSGDVVCNVELGHSDQGESSASVSTAAASVGTVDQGTAASASGAWPVYITGSSNALTPASAQVVVAAGPTATALGGATQADTLIIIADIDNTGNIYLGAAGVSSSDGLEMEPGRSVELKSVNLSAVYIYGTAGEGVSYFYTT